MSISWTSRQVHFLKAKFSEVPREELERELAPHPWNSIRAMGNRLGLRRRSVLTDWLDVCARHDYQTPYFREHARRQLLERCR